MSGQVTLRVESALLISAVAAMGAPAPVRAQNALGDGRALDSNLRVGSGGINPRGRDLLAEIRFRNAIVTGNAPAGMSLRVDVGYSAADDFRADSNVFGQGLGSNDLFDFNRDSLLSTVAGQGIRGIDALQVQMRLATGATVDDATGLPIIPIAQRAGASVSADQLRAIESQASLIDPFRVRPSSLRSTTEFSAADSLAPLVLGAARTEQGDRIYALASPLRGLQKEATAPDDAAPLPPDLLKSLLPRVPEAAPAQPSEPEAARKALENSATPNPDRIDTRMDTRVETRVEPNLLTFDDAMNRLRERLRAPAGEQAEAPAVQPVEPIEQPNQPAPGQGESSPAPKEQAGAQEQASSDRSGASLQDRLDAMRDALLSATRQRSGATTEQVIKEAQRLLGGEAPTVGRLAKPPAGDRDFFAQHMDRGEALLARGQFFDAEERFSRALSIRPGDPMAAIGRAHAQLGAGLYLSAGVNLERLLLARPELAAVRYRDDLLPSEARRQTLEADLKRLINQSGAMRARAGLLLAYLGWQARDKDAITQGLNAMRDSAQGADAVDPLERMLRAVWLGEAP